MRTLPVTKCRPIARAIILFAATSLLGCGAQAQTITNADYAKRLLKPLTALPLISAQPDGVVCMNWEAGALVTVANLTVEPKPLGSPSWRGDAVRPYWRIKLMDGGPYRVVINRACPPGRESRAAIFLRPSHQDGNGTSAVRSLILPTGDWDNYMPFVMGDTHLAAGEYLVECYASEEGHPSFQMSLRDVRLIPIGALAERERQAQPLMKRLRVSEDPAVRAVRTRLEELRAQQRAAEALIRRKSFEDFHSYDQFLAYDQELLGAHAAVNRLGAEIKQATETERESIRETAQRRADQAHLRAEELQPLRDYLRETASVQNAALREYPKAIFKPALAVSPSSPGLQTASLRKPLFPPGDLTDFPQQSLNERLPPVELSFPQPPDLAERKAQFQARNSAQGLAQLCARLAAVLVPGTPGLEEFERLAAAGKSGEALEAYRSYFFAKLAEPEKYGASVRNLMPVMPVASKRAQTIIMRPNSTMLEGALKGVAMVQASGGLVRGKMGEPGEVLWAPHDLTLPAGVQFRTTQGDSSPFWKTDAGKEATQRILFYRGIKPLRLGLSGDGLSSSLLYSYLVSGNREHLARFCAYVDDYTMHAQADMDDSPVNIRSAMDLEPHEVIPGLLLGMRLMFDERPEFARDLEAATLARLLMYAVEEYAPYNLRLRRAQLANWGIMGLSAGMKISAFLSEFKSINHFTREAWRLANMSFITYRELDGPCIESWDLGHSRTEMDFYDSGMVPARLPQDVGDGMQQRYLWDRMRVIERNFLTHTSPQGAFWPDWRARDFYPAVSLHFIRPMWSATGRIPLEQVKSETEAQRRIAAITAPGSAERPQRFSDYAPYAGISYLRDAWKPDAEYLLMQNVRQRSQSLLEAARTDYNLSKAGLCLVEGMPLAVDGKPQNHFYDSIPTGGKTQYIAQSQRYVQQARFLSSARFDLSEALQDSPYARFWDQRSQYMGIPDPFGLYLGKQKDPNPIRDVRDLRQVLHIRGEGLWIVHNRVHAPAGATHEYTQFFKLPVRLFPEGFSQRVALLQQAGYELIEENERERLIRTASPGADNVTVRLFCRERLQFANRLDAKGKPERLPRPIELISKALATGQNHERFMKAADMERWGRTGSLAVRPVSARWTGTGNQSLVTAMSVRPAVFQLSEPQGNDVRETEQTEGPGGVVGCRVVTRTGAEVWFQGGPETANLLACGPVAATAETLLFMRKEGRVSGMVLGCQQMTVAGKQVTLPRADFEFEIGGDGVLVVTQPIHKPIDTIRIQPDQTVFTESLQVTADIPGQDMSEVELHYTLQPASSFTGRDYEVTHGEEPTLESPRYTGPITVRESSLLKVRAFRKGLKETPWHCANTDASQTVTAIFRQQAPLPAVAPGAVGTTVPGLNYAYAEGHWPTLFAYTGDARALDATVGVKGTGEVVRLLDPADLSRLRTTDRAYAVRYSGYLQVPTTGVYHFHAPLHLYTPTLDAGYDLRVFVDGKEWWPNPMLHSENLWSVALEAGLHRLEVAYVDYRWRQFRDEYWINWMPEQMWKGTPVLEISGPGLGKQPIPAAWLQHERI